MKSVMKIPDEVKCYALTAGNKVSIDTNGLGCIMKPIDGDVRIKAKASEADSDAYVVSVGESFDFAGKITVFASKACSVCFLFYNTL